MVMRIKELRCAANMTQAELSAAMGVARNGISQWETEVALPRTRQLPQLAQVLGCSIDELFVPDLQPRPTEAF